MARENWVQSQVESCQRHKKWYLMLPCLTLSIIGYSKVEQSRERSSTLPYLGVVAIEKGAFGSPSTVVANFTFIYFEIRYRFGLVWFPCLILFTNPSTRAGYDTRSNFKRSLTGLNLEFSFS